MKAFAEASIPGNTLVWREVLSEGPAVNTIPEKEFWEKRQEFVTNAYPGASEEDYRQKVLEELSKLEGLSAFFEVVLWFDADLMCQLNLLYLLHRLQQNPPSMISVCTPAPETNIAHLSPSKLDELFQKRQQQSAEQLNQAHDLWELYAGPDPLRLQLYLEQFKIILPHMEAALKLHVLRFPDCQTGLSYPEQALLELVNEGANTKELLLQEFWHQLPEYGFGDAQILYLLNRLQPDLIQETAHLRLSFFGDRVLEGIGAFMPKPHWLGGVKVDAHTAWCYNKSTKRLALNGNSTKRK